MAKLTYTVNTSLDGFCEDEDGRFDWTTPSREVFDYITDLQRPVRTYLYGRRMYETMAVWQSIGIQPGAAPDELVAIGGGADFTEMWRAADRSCTPAPFGRWTRPARSWSVTSTPAPSPA